MYNDEIFLYLSYKYLMANIYQLYTYIYIYVYEYMRYCLYIVLGMGSFFGLFYVNIIYTRGKRVEMARTEKRNWRIYCWGVHSYYAPKEWLRVAENEFRLNANSKRYHFLMTTHTYSSEAMGLFLSHSQFLSLYISMITSCVSHLQIST